MKNIILKERIKRRLARRLAKRKYRKKNRIRERLYQRGRTTKYRSLKKNRLKRNARRRIEYLIKIKRIKKKPCKKCGKKKVEAHHPNYSFPDFIQWYCKTHHADKHYPLK